jgi:aryl-alcohol dehydrogenase-like predicted oxidoreductase
MKLGIGTVQFGFDYGISNKDGQTPESEVKDILSLAAERGLSVIDTASQYGTSETVIGLCLAGNHPFRIVTKTPSFQKTVLAAEDALLLKETFSASLRKLGQKSVYGLLVHHADDLLSGNSAVLWRAMQELKDSGLVEKIGVSVYSPEQADAVLRSFAVDLVQLPVNVLDQRMVHNGHLRRLKDRGIEIHSRSVFLQGLLLMNPSTVPEHFSPIRRQLIRYHALLHDCQIMPAAAALAFVSGIREIDVVIVGVNDASQLRELCETGCTDSFHQRTDFSSFAIDDEAMVNPSHWK